MAPTHSAHTDGPIESFLAVTHERWTSPLRASVPRRCRRSRGSQAVEATGTLTGQLMIHEMAATGARKAKYARRRKRRMARVAHDLSSQQWLAVQAAWGGCAYCRSTDVSLQRDCVLAVSRGGRYTLDNIVPACGSCNASKCNDEVTGWLRRKKLDERTFLERFYEISAALALQFPLPAETTA